MSALLAVFLVAAAGQDDARPSSPAPVLRPEPAAFAPAPKPLPREVYKLHLAVDIPVTVVAASAALVRELFRDQLARKSCPCDPNAINSLDRGTVGNNNKVAGTVSDITVYGLILALPLIDLVDIGIRRPLGQDLVVYAEALAIDTAIQNATNFIVARPRPHTYAGDPASLASGEGYLSFYAGHVSTAFTIVSVAAFTTGERYGEQVWPWIVDGLIGTSVAVERVWSGAHFPTDVAVAAVAGTAVGITVPWLHLRRGETHVQIAPIGSRGLGLVGAF